MSLAVFKTELVPSPEWRKLVLISGAAALLVGMAVILYLPLSFLWRSAIGAIWIIDCVRELSRVQRSNARISRLQLDANGNIFATRQDGRIESLVLLSGSVVSSRLAWFRLRFPDGSVGAELMTGDPLRDPRWQRLQLIWQQSAGAFASKN